MASIQELFESMEQEYKDCTPGRVRIVFVFNSLEDERIDKDHRSECVYPDEIGEIEDAFSGIGQAELTSFSSEEDFQSALPGLRKSGKPVFVYSMAQNTPGTGRRVLIPSLCEHNGFTNIGADARDSLIGGDKRMMFERFVPRSLQNERCFLDRSSTDGDIEKALSLFSNGRFLVKPIDESASIGMRFFAKRPGKEEIEKSIREYGCVLLEKYVAGEEIESTVLYSDGRAFVLPAVRIEKGSRPVLDYESVRINSYGKSVVEGEDARSSIERASLSLSGRFRFSRIARFDYIFAGAGPTLFDITANPTVSKDTTSACALKNVLPGRSIYQFLFYLSFHSYHLSQTVKRQGSSQ